MKNSLSHLGEGQGEGVSFMPHHEEQQTRRDFVKYSLFKVDPKWRGTPLDQRRAGKQEFASVLDEFADRVDVSSYSLVGTRGDADMMLWMVSPTLEAINELAAQLNRTALAPFLSTPYSYLAMTRRSPYVVNHRHEGQEGTSSTMRIVGRKYLFVYPFVKTHDWYQLPKEERQELMNEHFVIGHKYPGRENQHSLLLRAGRPGVRAGLRDRRPVQFPGPGDGTAGIQGAALHPAGHAHILLHQQAHRGLSGRFGVERASLSLRGRVRACPALDAGRSRATVLGAGNIPAPMMFHGESRRLGAKATSASSRRDRCS